MSELKATPGPWTVHHRMRDCVTFEGKHGTENLFLENLDGYYACQSEADAHLIAAAPELYRLLSKVESVFTLAENDEPLPDDRDGEQWLRETRAVLASARGEQP